MHLIEETEDRLGLGEVGATAAESESRRFRKVFRRQTAAILATVGTLTIAHFALVAGSLDPLTADILFVSGMALAAIVLVRVTRFVEGEIGSAFGSTQKSYLEAMQSLSMALDARDGYTADHAEQVVEMAVSTGRAMGMDDEALAALRQAALFHDIGKIGVPDQILNKPGPLTEDEWVSMKRHPAIGAEILTPIGFLSSAIPIVRHEHEHWNGSGYPDGLKGDAIPLGARVILVCDAFHAMTSDRPYRDALPEPEAVNRLLDASGSQFDPDVVKAFLEVRATSLTPRSTPEAAGRF